MYFTMMLSQRGYTGSMEFDHKSKALTITVNIDERAAEVNQFRAQKLKNKNKECENSDKDGRKNKKMKKMNGTKTLSGGERSFSTISFIIALWEAMECPFRILDEFDVFMVCISLPVNATYDSRHVYLHFSNYRMRSTVEQA